MVKQKAEIRKQVLAARRGLGREEVIRSSRIILEKAEKYLDLAQMDLYLYASCQNEVDTMQLIKDCLSRKQKIALPRVCEDGIHMKFYYITSLNDLTAGYKGIPEPGLYCEPAAENRQKIILVPGVAFDKKGNRIGYGKGFYDRYLKEHEFIKKMGIAFEMQVLEEIPGEPDDVQMDMVITEQTEYRR